MFQRAFLLQWRSEYRVYVIGAEIVAMDHYAGDPHLRVCSRTIAAALAQLAATGTSPAAYGIDFGVLDTGETALVEANDGYALGAHTITAEPYTRLLFTRWQQLLLS